MAVRPHHVGQPPGAAPIRLGAGQGGPVAVAACRQQVDLGQRVPRRRQRAEHLAVHRPRPHDRRPRLPAGRPDQREDLGDAGRGVRRAQLAEHRSLVIAPGHVVVALQPSPAREGSSRSCPPRLVPRSRWRAAAPGWSRAQGTASHQPSVSCQAPGAQSDPGAPGPRRAKAHPVSARLPHSPGSSTRPADPQPVATTTAGARTTPGAGPIRPSRQPGDEAVRGRAAAVVPRPPGERHGLPGPPGFGRGAPRRTPRLPGTAASRGAPATPR